MLLNRISWFCENVAWSWNPHSCAGPRHSGCASVLLIIADCSVGERPLHIFVIEDVPRSHRDQSEKVMEMLIQILRRISGNKLHDDVRVAILLAEVVNGNDNGNDVGMIQDA
jgi:hypothetical protein